MNVLYCDQIAYTACKDDENTADAVEGGNHVGVMSHVGIIYFILPVELMNFPPKALVKSLSTNLIPASYHH